MAEIGLLSKIVINTPCTEDWAKMSGDAQKRFCGRCSKNVYNLREMSRAEAEALITGGSVCVRLYRRPDGTVLTKECGVGMRRRWRTRAIFGGLMLAMLSGLGIRRNAMAEDPPAILGEPQATQLHIDRQVMGRIAVVKPQLTPSPKPTNSPAESEGKKDDLSMPEPKK